MMYKNLIDYTGKLNNHEDYLKILNILEDKTDYIELAYENDIVYKFKKDILYKKHTTSWFSEESFPGANLYRIKASKELFDYLKTFETFCKCFIDPYTGVYLSVEETDFGISDIAFYDKEGKSLLETVTHEGEIFIRDDLLK